MSSPFGRSEGRVEGWLDAPGGRAVSDTAHRGLHRGDPARRRRLRLGVSGHSRLDGWCRRAQGPRPGARWRRRTARASTPSGDRGAGRTQGTSQRRAGRTGRLHHEWPGHRDGVHESRVGPRCRRTGGHPGRARRLHRGGNGVGPAGRARRRHRASRRQTAEHPRQQLRDREALRLRNRGDPEVRRVPDPHDRAVRSVREPRGARRRSEHRRAH